MSQKRQVNARLAVDAATLERFRQYCKDNSLTARQAINRLLDIAALPTLDLPPEKEQPDAAPCSRCGKPMFDDLFGEPGLCADCEHELWAALPPEPTRYDIEPAP